MLCDYAAECCPTTKIDPESSMSLNNGFRCLGVCYRDTGISHSTYDLAFAKECMAQLRIEAEDGESFRIVRMHVRQELAVFAEETFNTIDDSCALTHTTTRADAQGAET